MTVKREKIFPYFFIFLILFLQNISAQKPADRQKPETSQTVSGDEKNLPEKSSAFGFSKTAFESTVNDFRYNFLDNEIKKNRKFVTDEENEELKRRSFTTFGTIVSEKNADKSKPCEYKKLN